MKKEDNNKPVVQGIHLEFDTHSLENEIWLTINETMQHLNVSRSTIYRQRKANRIPSFKLGNTPMFPKHLLNKILLQRAIRNVKEF
ncbi:helix-turn-helix domain-containing protein [Winogradskyella wichelsiae]|uniref:helix-turn-helix domain-containing protein n=1 Tax=Winogradskyella wichelsiae TaxID=2697007 RepID=UPI0015C6EE45|nr:helix-turn-helix domain-containing protein [Winogradskyella wichelsiae]